MNHVFKNSLRNCFRQILGISAKSTSYNLFIVFITTLCCNYSIWQSFLVLLVIPHILYGQSPLCHSTAAAPPQEMKIYYNHLQYTRHTRDSRSTLTCQKCCITDHHWYLVHVVCFRICNSGFHLPSYVLLYVLYAVHKVLFAVTNIGGIDAINQFPLFLNTYLIDCFLKYGIVLITLRFNNLLQ